MFSEEERGRLRDELVAAAREDGRIVAAAVLGSGASGDTDRWSDVDLGFGVAGDRDAVLDDWTRRMYDRGAVDHLDIVAGPSIYRAFLLGSSLQVDLSFTPADRFGAVGPTFRLLFGTAVEREEPARPDLIGMGWLYAVHARSALARDKVWQADHMIGGLRDTALALACVRHGLPAAQARGTDRLPAEVTDRAARARARTLDGPELARAARAALDLFRTEAARSDPDRARRLDATLRTIV